MQKLACADNIKAMHVVVSSRHRYQAIVLLW